MLGHSATYSLADDKLRLYPGHRLPEEEYNRVKNLGFSWAPKQGLFFAIWTPAREDLVLALAEDIEDEDTTPEERTAARAERFQGYSDHAGERSTAAHQRSTDLVANIPMGQPILVGHYSERHHRATLEKSDSAMRRAVDEMKRSDYWQRRAEATLAHAERRERPDVIYRRIKSLEAEKRAKERLTDKSSGEWENTSDWLRDFHKKSEAEIETIWQTRLADANRWIAHLENRIAYERVLLENAGGLPTDQKNIEVGGAVRYYGRWCEITKVTRRNGEVSSVRVKSAVDWLNNALIKPDKINEILTAEEYQAQEK